MVRRSTDDREAVLATIDRLTPQGGTSLGEGIFTALYTLSDHPLTPDGAALEEGTISFQLEEFSSAVVILLTDGENTDFPDSLQVAQIAA